MKRKLLITGSQGMLGTDLACLARQLDLDVTPLSHQDLDITSAAQVKEVLESIRPDYIINTAGVGVDFCSTNPEEGYRVHAWGAACVARHAQRIGATLVHISSCGLFGDEIKFYSEYDPVELKTIYARSKYLGEVEALARCERLYVVRCGWLFGGTSSHSRNFVFQRFNEAREKPVVKSAGDKFGSPTHTGALASKVLQLLETEEYGLYHVTNHGGGSRYDYVKCIVEAFGLTTAVEEVDSSFFPRQADTPSSEMLDNLNLRFLGLELLEPWQEATHRYVVQLKKEIGL